ncbi:hypothetical protein CCMSSC00406_0000216 [Pleurotus cornucopiae]|uniref:Uncharacterized protein n=1 Tax=Pleurotus cornucopiae TaxID=5321 RepID=A0ACB7IZB4_PLECO|nr:hypothetical protein CCMSSC00406_0000216 [Pleurotus cornucopiae]
MDINDLHPQDDHGHRFFIWHEWLQAYGPLTAENAFDYFTSSMFYDKQSNNQVLRMQTMHTGMPLLNEAEELRRFTGVEFALVHAEPPSLFIIHKRERLSPDEVRPLAAYFIANNRIYQAPDIYTVLSNRLLATLHSLQNSLNILRRHRPDYTPRTGFIWPIADPSIPDDSHPKPTVDADGDQEMGTAESDSQKVTGKKALTEVSAGPKKQQNTMLLFNAMRTTAVHSKVTPPSVPAAAENVEMGTPAPFPGFRAPATPVTPASDTIPSVPQKDSGLAEQPKGIPGAGKKKRKRTLNSQPQP